MFYILQCFIYYNVSTQVNEGAHSPNRARVNIPLSNMPEFAHDWRCPAGSKMSPKKRCSVWTDEKSESMTIKYCVLTIFVNLCLAFQYILQ